MAHHDDLPVATPEPETWRFRCPTCERLTEGVELDQDDSGAYRADGPDEFQLCDECDILFRVGRVHVRPANA